MEQNENTGDKPLKDMWEIVMNSTANPLAVVSDNGPNTGAAKPDAFRPQ